MGATRGERQMLAQPNAGSRGGNAAKLAAILNGSVGFWVEGVELTGAAEEENLDARPRLLSGRRRRDRRLPHDVCQAEGQRAKAKTSHERAASPGMVHGQGSRRVHSHGPSMIRRFSALTYLNCLTATQDGDSRMMRP